MCFEFSRNAVDMYMFIQTLKEARDYAATIKRPFPNIDFENLDPHSPESFYVFEEEGKPTVIHIPLFNMDNCKG